jgi:predicted AAA+ superfamily ATPase
MTAMYTRIFKAPKQSFFLLGARGTGKTTFLKANLKGAHFINLLDEAKYQSYLGDIELFKREVTARPQGQTVVIDEVQRLPELLNYVHDLIESQRRHFVLTGSSARKLKRKGVNLLAGRALVKYLYPLLPTELEKDFNILRCLRQGTIPLVVDSTGPEETLKSYVLSYLSEEIKSEALVKNLAGFSRFLPVAALFHGQTINVSNVARDCGVSRTTVNGFFEILQDTLVADLLPAYSSSPKVREVKHPKFFFFDPGIVRVLKKQSGEVDDDEKGVLFEGFIYHCLRAYNSYLNLFDEITYWAPLDAKSQEVDFVLRQGKQLIAIEVKAKNKLRPDDLLGLKAIQSIKGVKKRILVYLGNETQDFSDGIQAIPVREFCEMLAQSRLRS